jgi:hypothetical protein
LDCENLQSENGEIVAEIKLGDLETRLVYARKRYVPFWLTQLMWGAFSGII